MAVRRVQQLQQDRVLASEEQSASGVPVVALGAFLMIVARRDWVERL